ncbi:hypothetical protein N9N67_12310, partial [Bacteriovoracaceae bacterium]|nr:hypothetical protein [Bacteriovoracaceae bacterium]
MSDKSQVMFKKIQDDEKSRKLAMLAQNKAEVIIWEKGQKSRHHFNASYFDKLKTSILVNNISDEDYSFKNPLISFEMAGVAYFGKVKFEQVKEGYVVKCTQDIFKSER